MEKVSLPIKTKIAAWWMIVSGILAIISLIQLFSPPPRPEFGGGIVDIIGIIIFGPILLVIGIVFFTSATLLFTKRKLGWWLSTIIILPLGCFVLGISRDIIRFHPLPFFVLIPFLLLLLDRKNFWKVAT